MLSWNDVIRKLSEDEAVVEAQSKTIVKPTVRETKTIDQMIKELKALRKIEGGDAKVYVCNGKEDVGVMNIIIDHGAIVING